jgi:hypothetical protein
MKLPVRQGEIHPRSLRVLEGENDRIVQVYPMEEGDLHGFLKGRSMGGPFACFWSEPENGKPTSK